MMNDCWSWEYSQAWHAGKLRANSGSGGFKGCGGERRMHVNSQVSFTVCLLEETASSL